MSSTVAMLNDLSPFWIDRLWTVSWQGAIVLLLVPAMTWIAGRMPPQARCWLWRAALCHLLIAFAWYSPVELPWIPVDATTTSVVAKKQAGANSDVVNGPSDTNQRENLATAGAVEARSPATPRRTVVPLSLNSWLVLGWAGGMLLLLTRMLAQSVLVCRAVSRMCPVEDRGVRRQVSDVSEQLGIGYSPQIRLSPVAGTACVVGVWRAQIVLPSDMPDRCSDEELRAAIAHELAHVQRRDLLWNWLSGLAEAVFFFHPLVWFAGRELRLAQEIAADERAVSATGGDVATYAGTLIRLIEQCPPEDQHPRMVLAVGGSYSMLSRRMKAMKRFESNSRRHRAAFWFVPVALIAVSGIPWELTAQERSQGNVATAPDAVNTATDVRRAEIANVPAAPRNPESPATARSADQDPNSVPGTDRLTAERFRLVGEAAAAGDLTRLDELADMCIELYEGVDLDRDLERGLANLKLMRAAFAPIGKSGASGSRRAMFALRDAITHRRLRPFAVAAVGTVAAAGRSEAIEILIHHERHDILKSTAVSALAEAAESADDRVVAFLSRVVESKRHRPLWFMARNGLETAAEQGHQQAATVLQQLQERDAPKEK